MNEDKINVAITIPEAVIMKDSEYETLLNDDETVKKDHPVIMFRGKLDIVGAHIVSCGVQAKKEGLDRLGQSLLSLLDCCISVMRAEVRYEPMGDFRIMDMTPQKLREYSHHPKKHFGTDHFLPDFETGEMMARLNMLRTEIREAERLAVAAFIGPDTERTDIVTALNRMSSAAYIMMCMLKTGKYI